VKKVIEFDNVGFAYETEKKVLQSVSFSIAEGETVALIGANGAGKSTLILHTNGTVFSNVGEVRVMGARLTEKTVASAKQVVGLVFQNPDDQLFMPTVELDVGFGPKNMGLSAQEIEARVCDALSQVDGLELRNRFSHKLSGGEKRRIAIATVLAMRPNLLVLDEPSSHLDPRSRARLISTLKGFSQAKLIATHDLDLALDLCQRAIVLCNGKVVFDGPTVDAFKDAELVHSWGLERPFQLRPCLRCGGER
jgi:cobalt/nickel transport system ATP-binding protein